MLFFVVLASSNVRAEWSFTLALQQSRRVCSLFLSDVWRWVPVVQHKKQRPFFLFVFSSCFIYVCRFSFTGSDLLSSHCLVYLAAVGANDKPCAAGVVLVASRRDCPQAAAPGRTRRKWRGSVGIVVADMPSDDSCFLTVGTCGRLCHVRTR